MNNNFSIGSENLEEFKYLLEEKISQLGKPSLAILFVNADLDINGIHNYMEINQIPHIGASSAGELCNQNFQLGLYSGLFMYLPKDCFKIYHTPKEESTLSGINLGSFAKEQYKNPGIYTLIASKNLQTDLYIEEVQQATYDEIPLYGGHAFDNLKYEKYTIFSNNYLSNEGVVSIIFDCNKVEIYGDAYSGWDSIGITHTITKSDKNELLEIDGKPALDIFTDYFDYFDIEKVARGEDDSFGIGNHPIKIIDKSGAGSLKSAISLNLERKSMSFFCSLPVGTQFKFCTNPKLEITDNLIARIDKLKKEVEDLDCILITSCAGRHLTLGPFFKKEIKRLYRIWNKPMAGFLSGGEIGNVKTSNKSFFHNVTCVFTGFKLK